MADITELIASVTESQYFTALTAAYDEALVSWRSWSTRNAFMGVSKFATKAASALRDSVTEIARGNFLQFARGVALTLFSKSQYQLDRQPATFAKGRAVIKLSPGVSPIPIIAGQLRMGTPGPITEKSKIFVSTTAQTLNPGENNLVEFIAENTGDTYNLPNGSPVDLKTSLVGATISIPATGEPTTIGAGNAALVFFSARDSVTVNIVYTGVPLQPLAVAANNLTRQVTIILPLDGVGALIANALVIRQAVVAAIASAGPVATELVAVLLGGDGTGIVQPTGGFITLDFLGSWLSVQGQPEQGDDSLAEDDANRWDTLGGGAGDGATVSDAETDSALAFWAKRPPAGRARSPVEQVRVYSNSNDLGVLDGAAALVVIAGAAGPLPQQEVDAVAANFEKPQKYSYGTTLYVKSSVAAPVPISGTVNVSRKSGRTLAEAQNLVLAALIAEKRFKRIGGVIHPSIVNAVIVDADRPAIDSYLPISPSAPVLLGFDQTAALDVTGLAFQLVD